MRADDDINPDPAAAQAQLLARAYARVLSWPCATCGMPAPCHCDYEAVAADQANNRDSQAEITSTDPESQAEALAGERGAL